MEFLPFSIAAVTPFDQEGNFDVSSVPGLIRYYIEEADAPGLLISGSTGDQHVLTIDERIQLYQAVREAAGPEFPLYAGVSAFRTKDAIKLAKAAAANHYQAIMLGFPPYRIPLQAQALEYAKEVCAAVPETCVFAYNCPQCTGFDLAVDTFVEMVNQIPNIHGIKEVGNSSNVPAILEKTPRSVTALTGFDLCIVPQFKMGYTCITSMAANVSPKTMKKVVDLVVSGDYETALTELEPVRKAMTLIEKNSFSPCVKYILRKRGVSAGYSPLPLCEPSAEVLKQLDELVDVV